MALERDTVPVSLAQGLGQKVDDKIAGPSQSTVVADAVFDKEGRLTKRFGQSSLGQAVQNAPGSLSFGTSAGPTKVFSHEDQLCLANNGGLYSQVQGQNAWNYVGPYVNVSVNPKQVDPQRLASDLAQVGGITITGGGAQVIVIETATGVTLARTTMASPTETVVRVIGFSNAAYILTCDIPAAGVAASTTLNAYSVNLVTGQLGPKLTLASDVSTRVTLPANVANLGYALIDVAVTTSASALGECAVISYFGASNLRLIVFQNGGSAPLFAPFDTTFGGSQNGVCVYIEPSINANTIYVAGTATNFGLIVGSYTLSASGVSVNWPAAQKVSQADTFYRITMAFNPAGTSLSVYYDTHFDTSVGGWYFPAGNVYARQAQSQTPTGLTGFPHSLDCKMGSVTLDLTGAVISSNANVARGLVIAAKAYRDLVRGAVYLPVMALSPLQSTYFLIDVTNTSAGKLNVQAKWNYRSASNGAQSSGIRFVQPGTIFKWFSNPYVSKSLDLFNDQAFYLPPSQVVSTGAQSFAFAGTGSLHRVSLNAPYAAASAYIGRTTNLVGGQLWAYDGQSLSEQNFLMAPEVADVFCGSASVAVNNAGTSSSPQISTYTFQAGSYYQGTTGYYTLYTASNSRYVWFQVDGVGTDPAPAGLTGIQVNVSSTDTPANVAYKSFLAISSVILDASVYNPVNYPGTGANFPPLLNQVVVQNNQVGSVTQPSTTFAADVPTLAASSSYQYCAIFKWTDRNGNVYRSAPSVAATLSTGASVGTTMVTFTCPPITAKIPSEVEVEVYRTVAMGTTFYKLTGTLNVPKLNMKVGQTRVQFKDSMPDIYLKSKAILYTNGGVAENFSAGACTSVSTFKNRLLVTLVDDPTAIYYSKTLVTSEPANLSEFNAIRFGDDSSPVTATAQMDDKLVVLKARSLFVTAGDGSNDLGQAETFQLPIRIPGEYGTNNPNSVILSDPGLLFQTPNKGIHCLTRGLSVEYIGAPVDDYRTNTVSSAVQARNYEHIVFGLQDSPVSLVYNIRFQRWDTWTNQRSDSAALWGGQYVRGQSAGKVFVESTNYFDVDGANLPIQMTVETVWLKMKNLQSFARVYAVNFLGTYLSPHVLNVTIGFDFDPVTANYESHTFDAGLIIGQGGTLPGDQTYQVQIQPARQKCNAIKLKLTEVPGTGSQASAYFHAIDLECGLKQGLNRVKGSKGI